VLKWPDRQSVDQAVRRWARAVVHGRDDVLAIAYLGSYARGDWGVGSDLDLLVLIIGSELPFHPAGGGI
jgi:predicted nucleotidyltransferase